MITIQTDEYNLKHIMYKFTKNLIEETTAPEENKMAREWKSLRMEVANDAAYTYPKKG